MLTCYRQLSRLDSGTNKNREGRLKRAAFVLGGVDNIPGKQRSLRRPPDNARFQGDEKLVQLLELLA